jgi:outer membrane protein TolC
MPGWSLSALARASSALTWLAASFYAAEAHGADLASQAVIDLPTAARLAKERAPGIQAALHSVQRAEADTRAASAAHLPTLGADARASLVRQHQSYLVPGSSQGVASTTAQLTSSLQARWVAFDAGARQDSVEQARAERAVAEAEVRRTEYTVVRAASELYVRVVTTERLLADAKLSVERRQATLTAIERLIEAGLRPSSDHQRAEIDAVAARFAVDVLREQSRTEHAAFAAALGLEPSTLIELQPYADLLFCPPQAQAQPAVWAMQNRPEIVQGQARLRERRANLDKAHAQRWPTLGVDANASFEHGSIIAGDGFAGNTFAVSAGVVLNWQALNLSIWRLADGAAADVQVAASELADRELSARTQATLALGELARARAALEQARQVLQAAAATLSTQRRRYELGQATLLELLDAEAIEQDARSRVILAERDQDLSGISLLDATGFLLARLGA